MYTVSIGYSDGDTFKWLNVYHPQTKDADHHLSNMVCIKEVNKAGSFTFTMPKGNVGYNKIVPRKTEVIVYKNNTIYWRGRVISYNRDFKMNLKVTCEGILAYLNDVISVPVWRSRMIGQYNYKGRVDTTNQLPISYNNAENDMYYVGFESSNPAANYEVYVWCKNVLIDTTNYAIEGRDKTLLRVNSLPPKEKADPDTIYVTAKSGSNDGYYVGNEYDPIKDDWVTTDNIAYVNTKDTWVYKGLSDENQVLLNMTAYFDLVQSYYLSHSSGYNNVFIAMDDPVRTALSIVDVNEIYSNWNNVLSEINEVIIADRGYALVTDYANSTVHICMFGQSGSSEPTAPTQTIMFGENLLDYVVDMDASELITSIIPLGDNSLTIYDVNNGEYNVKSIYADIYGLNEKVIRYENISDPYTLLTAAMSDLGKISPSDIYEISVNAVDLHDLGANVSAIDIGSRVSVASQPHQVNEAFLCTYISIDLDDPSNSEYRFGSYNRNATPTNNIISAKSASRSSDMINEYDTAYVSTRSNTIGNNSTVLKLADNAASYEYDDRTILVAATGTKTSRNGFESFIFGK